MYQMSENILKPTFRHLHTHASEAPMRCNLRVLTGLLLKQWNKLTREELERTRFVKERLARLIEHKYGVNATLAENYLSNIERTLPVSH